jgi:large subunit ribosomal protein L2
VALKVLKPVTPSSRGQVRINHKATVTTSKPTKRLTKHVKQAKGRSHGKISMHHQGGGVKKLYREIDFGRKIREVVGKVETIEYDPNRNVYISLIAYQNGTKAYILNPEGVKVGDKVQAGDEVSIEVGNATKLSRIPVGTPIHNIELNPGSGGTLVRSAGSSATILGVDKEFAQVRLPSKEVRLINSNSYATIGTLSNSDYKNIVLGKAGRKRWKGVRPTTRGMVQDPASHPHGGGEAKGVIGHTPRDKWGNIRGKLTRRKRNRFNKFRLVNRKGRKIVTK